MKNLFFHFFFIFFACLIPACGDSFLESDYNDSISVFGTVLTEDGSPAQGARVLVQDVGVPSAPAAIMEIAVSKTGKFFGVIYGVVDYAEIRFVIEAEGYTTAVYPQSEYFPIVITIGVPLNVTTVLQKTVVIKKEEAL